MISVNDECDKFEYNNGRRFDREFWSLSVETSTVIVIQTYPKTHANKHNNNRYLLLTVFL